MKYILVLFVVALVACKSSVDSPIAAPSLEKATVVTYENMNVADFASSIKSSNSVVLDVRTPEEISGGSIENSLALDFYEDDFAEQLLAMDKSQDYYIYCKGGGRSAKTCRLMIKNGFTKVHNLDGGYKAWKKEMVE